MICVNNLQTRYSVQIHRDKALQRASFGFAGKEVRQAALESSLAQGAMVQKLLSDAAALQQSTSELRVTRQLAGNPSLSADGRANDSAAALAAATIGLERWELASSPAACTSESS